MKAIKANKVYSVTSEEAKAFKAQGFDIFDEKGKLVEHGSGSSVSLEEYEALKAENQKLKADIKKLKASQTEKD